MLRSNLLAIRKVAYTVMYRKGQLFFSFPFFLHSFFYGWLVHRWRFSLLFALKLFSIELHLDSLLHSILFFSFFWRYFFEGYFLTPEAVRVLRFLVFALIYWVPDFGFFDVLHSIVSSLTRHYLVFWSIVVLLECFFCYGKPFCVEMAWIWRT